MSYIIYDEDEQPMRIVGRKEEAISICNIRKGWTFKYMKPKANKDRFNRDLSQFKEALI